MISDMCVLVAESEAERFESTVDNGNDNVELLLIRNLDMEKTKTFQLVIQQHHFLVPQ